MKKITFTGKHLDCLSAWAGHKISLEDNFEELIESEVDYIEILLLFEKHFALNLLETEKSRNDFSTVEKFVTWALEHPAMEPMPYSGPEDLPFAKHLQQRHYICQQVGT